MKKRIIVVNLKEFFHFGIDKPFSILAQLERVVYDLDSYTETIEIEYMGCVFKFAFQEARIEKNGLVTVKYLISNIF